MDDGTEGSNLDEGASKESAKILPLSSLDDSKGADDESDIGSELVTARGTGDGLVLRLDGRATHKSLMAALKQFVNSRRSFLEGNKVALEWVAGVPEDTFVSQITETLKADFKVHVSSSLLWEASSKDARPSAEKKLPTSSEGRQENLNLFSGIDALSDSSNELSSEPTSVPDFEVGSSKSSESQSFGGSVWDDPDARVVYATLRSGQKIETEHTLIVIGDVNSGAELVAGGDIIVLGTLRGVAHAGAYDESGGGRFICALSLQPTQLRIGVVISRGGATKQTGSSPCPEIARVEGNNIVVEPYSPRLVRGRVFN